MSLPPELYQMEGLVVYLTVDSLTPRRTAGTCRDSMTARTDPEY